MDIATYNQKSVLTVVVLILTIYAIITMLANGVVPLATYPNYVMIQREES